MYENKYRIFYQVSYKDMSILRDYFYKFRGLFSHSFVMLNKHTFDNAIPVINNEYLCVGILKEKYISERIYNIVEFCYINKEDYDKSSKLNIEEIIHICNRKYMKRYKAIHYNIID